jgi:hypothetical protein
LPTMICRWEGIGTPILAVGTALPSG